MNSEDFVDNVLTNLKVIGMLQKNSKLCVRKGQLAIDGIDHWQPVRRWIFKDSRDTVLSHARLTINNAVRIAKMLCCSSDTGGGVGSNLIPVDRCHSTTPGGVDMRIWILTTLTDEMRACEMGLRNLKTTYMSDAMMVASLDVLIDKLRANHSDMSQYLARRMKTAATTCSPDCDAVTNQPPDAHQM